jgi:histidinol-phosphate/aromatic aminotransferase/cobyric acid decarboxylase-like protein
MTGHHVPPPGSHGGDGARLAAALGLDPGAILDLSASLNPVAPDPAELIAKHLDALGRYPDCSRATAALAESMGVDRSRLLLTNGGAEAISLVAAELGGGPASEPEFSLYPRSEAGPRWRSNPNNPTGRLSMWDARISIWDEAFYPLATGEWTAGWPGVVVGSLTKVFACPGLRLGYVLADPDEPELVDRLRARQPEWSVNGLAAAALPDLLATADLPAWRDRISELRNETLSFLNSFDPQPSDANFVLCLRAAGLRDRLAHQGVLVRDCSSFGLPDAVRVAVPDEAGLQRLEEALCAAG